MATNTDTWVWSFVWLERLWQDTRYGCRMLAANPGFTLVAVCSLALGIGANCAAFSWADALLLRPLTVARPGEVVTVGSAMSVEGFVGVGGARTSTTSTFAIAAPASTGWWRPRP